MTVKELRIELEKYPDEMDVALDERITQDEFKLGILNSVSIKEVEFYDEGDSDCFAKDTVVILSED